MLMNKEQQKQRLSSLCHFYDKELKELLKELYTEKKMSDKDISKKIKRETDLMISRRTIGYWRQILSIKSRTRKQAFRLVYRDSDGKTEKMRTIETALGGQEIDKLLPFLFSLGYTCKEVVDFIKNYGVSVKRETVFSWMYFWGYSIQKLGFEAREKKRKERSIRRRRRPELRRQMSKRKKEFFDHYPEAREYRSLLLKQRWQGARSKVLCPLFDEFKNPDDCETIQQSFAEQCQDVKCKYLKAELKEVK